MQGKPNVTAGSDGGSNKFGSAKTSRFTKKPPVDAGHEANHKVLDSAKRFATRRAARRAARRAVTTPAGLEAASAGSDCTARCAEPAVSSPAVDDDHEVLAIATKEV